MTVPEAPVNEDDGAVLRENDVRLSRQAGRMQPKAKASPVEKATKKAVRRRAARARSASRMRPSGRDISGSSAAATLVANRAMGRP